MSCSPSVTSMETGELTYKSLPDSIQIQWTSYCSEKKNLKAISWTPTKIWSLLSLTSMLQSVSMDPMDQVEWLTKRTQCSRPKLLLNSGMKLLLPTLKSWSRFAYLLSNLKCHLDSWWTKLRKLKRLPQSIDNWVSIQLRKEKRKREVTISIMLRNRNSNSSSIRKPRNLQRNTMSITKLFPGSMSPWAWHWFTSFWHYSACSSAKTWSQLPSALVLLMFCRIPSTLTEEHSVALFSWSLCLGFGTSSIYSSSRAQQMRTMRMVEWNTLCAASQDCLPTYLSSSESLCS